jgi:eukaryotic-like serine/threonine-protein kinase
MTPRELRERALERVGTTVREKWKIDGLLGVGGTAAVYAATHRNGKRAALKVLRQELLGSKDLVARFVREGYVANRLKHPCVCEILDDDSTDEGAPFLVMELLTGHSLERYSKPQYLLPMAEVVALIDKTLDVLTLAHEQGIVHRDIKPANLFLTHTGELKVLDFGIARIQEPLEASMTQTGTAIGTPSYMAPEQARGRWKQVDARTDIWAAGGTLFALLSGQKPRRAETVQEELLSAMTERVPNLRDVCTDVPEALAWVADRALAFEREDRFQNAREMQGALREAAESIGLVAQPTSPRIALVAGAQYRRGETPHSDSWVRARPGSSDPRRRYADAGMAATSLSAAPVSAASLSAASLSAVPLGAASVSTGSLPIDGVLEPSMASEPPRPNAVFGLAVGCVLLAAVVMFFLGRTVLAGSEPMRQSGRPLEGLDEQTHVQPDGGAPLSPSLPSLRSQDANPATLGPLRR